MKINHSIKLTLATSLVFSTIAPIIPSMENTEVNAAVAKVGVAKKNIEVYSSSTSKKKKLGLLAKGKKIKYYSKGRTWTKVKFKGKTAFIKTSALDFNVVENKLVNLATKKGATVTAKAISLKNAINVGDLAGLIKANTELQKSIDSYNSYVKNLAVSTKNQNALISKYITPNQALVNSYKAEISLSDTLDKALTDITAKTYEDTTVYIEQLQNKVDTINETRIANGYNSIPNVLISKFNIKIDTLKEQAKKK